MKEDFLHYLWKFKKFDSSNAGRTNNSSVTILDVGFHNQNSGPDFFNARVVIDGQLWAGNVEIHIKSSDWYLHRHELDPNYDNVILHVVWEDDMEIFRKDNSAIPTFELKEVVQKDSLRKYNSLLNSSANWINCEKDFRVFDDFTLNNWLERIYYERLEEKSITIREMLYTSGNNWEEVLFKLLLKSFGSKVNAESFESLANNLDFNIVQKLVKSASKLEALIFGQAGLLEEDEEEPYFNALKLEYAFFKQKHKLDNSVVIKPQYFRLRPDNFPNIRLSQFAQLYSKTPQLFSRVMACDTKEQLYVLLSSGTSEFWESHYTFRKSHKTRKKKLTSNFIDLLIINTVIPLKYIYLRETGNQNASEMLEIIQQINPEKNSIIENFNRLRPKTAENALQSQALLHLKKEYCDKNACLKCSLGTKLIQGVV